MHDVLAASWRPATSPRLLPVLVLAQVMALLAGCSVRDMASMALADSLARTGQVFARDDDPQLVAEATPFALKTMEAVLQDQPQHGGLLLALARGYTQYAYAFVQLPAERLQDTDLDAARAMQARARNLYLRGRDYGLHALRVSCPDLGDSLRADPQAIRQACDVADVAGLYWTGAAWAGAIALGKDQPALVAELPQVDALIRRAEALDPDHDEGALQVFLIGYAMAALQPLDARVEQARRHFERAVALSEGKHAAPFLAYAEAVEVKRQDRRAFEARLHEALEVQADAEPGWTLANRIAQQRARWLLGRVDDLFLD